MQWPDLTWHDFGRSEGASAARHREGKFVIIDDYTKMHFCLSTYTRTPYHANIVALFCQQVGCEYQYNSARSDLKSREIDVLGGGHFVLDEDAMDLRLFGHSTAYGSVQRRGLRDRLLAIPFLQGYTILVETD